MDSASNKMKDTDQTEGSPWRIAAEAKSELQKLGSDDRFDPQYWNKVEAIIQSSIEKATKKLKTDNEALMIMNRVLMRDQDGKANPGEAHASEQWTMETVRQLWRENQRKELMDDEQWNTFFQSVADAHNTQPAHASEQTQVGAEDFAIIEKAIGDLADSAAQDLDHYQKNHAKWYRAVKKARKTLAGLQASYNCLVMINEKRRQELHASEQGADTAKLAHDIFDHLPFTEAQTYYVHVIKQRLDAALSQRPTPATVSEIKELHTAAAKLAGAEVCDFKHIMTLDEIAEAESTPATVSEVATRHGEQAVTLRQGSDTLLWDEKYIDERLGRDASWPQIIEAANYSIRAALSQRQ